MFESIMWHILGYWLYVFFFNYKDEDFITNKKFLYQIKYTGLILDSLAILNIIIL